ncbi:MAG: copper homeostasis protein CutC [bacterium]
MPASGGIKIEVCVDSVESALAAQEGGAHRIELCNNLIEGGTTPSAGAIQTAREHLNIGLNVLIRPRGGDFLYSETEHTIIKQDILTAKRLKADGVVIGFLSQDGSVDTSRTLETVRWARPMSVTFHRAFDMCRDPFEALEDIIACGADRILTSGQKNHAEDGIELLTELQKCARGRIIIMPGSGINEANIEKIHRKVRASEYHVSLRRTIPSEMTYRKEGIFMGGHSDIPEYERKVTDADRVREIIKIVEQMAASTHHR